LTGVGSSRLVTTFEATGILYVVPNVTLNESISVSVNAFADGTLRAFDAIVLDPVFLKGADFSWIDMPAFPENAVRRSRAQLIRARNCLRIECNKGCDCSDFPIKMEI